MSGFDCDLFVIGGGSGGVRAARIAAAEGGARVMLAEESRMGGTCVIRGCVPKKLMVYASEYPGAIADARAYGWQVSPGGFDWPQFRRQLEAELDRLEGAYRNTLKNAGVIVHDQRAKLVDPHTVALADGTRITAAHILIATGGRPFVPDVPGADLAITSNEIFHLDALPQSALVVGGGYIASEFACILNGLGVEVAQYYRGAQILRGFDDECRGHVANAMQAAGIAIHCNTDVARLEHARGVAYHAADAAPLEGAALARAASGVALHPSVQLLRARHAFVTIWSAHQPGAQLPEIDAMRPEIALVLRNRRLDVEVWSLSQADSLFVDCLRRTGALIGAVGAARALEPQYDPAPLILRLATAGAFISREETDA